MTIGQVLGTVSLERTLPNAEKLHWAQIKVDDKMMVALDLVGAKPQDLVLLCASDVASMLTPECPVDAAIIGIVSEKGNRG